MQSTYKVLYALVGKKMLLPVLIPLSRVYSNTWAAYEWDQAVRIQLPIWHISGFCSLIKNKVVIMHLLWNLFMKNVIRLIFSFPIIIVGDDQLTAIVAANLCVFHVFANKLYNYLHLLIIYSNRRMRYFAHAQCNVEACLWRQIDIAWKNVQNRQPLSTFVCLQQENEAGN